MRGDLSSEVASLDFQRCQKETEFLPNPLSRFSKCSLTALRQKCEAVEVGHPFEMPKIRTHL